MKLFYRRLGNGEPLIILHGLFGMSDNWMTIAKKLAEIYQVFLPDQRNHGQSPNDPHFDYSVLVEDLNAFITERQLNEVRLLGHSLGGKVAMRYALTFPQRVKKLIIIDIAPKPYVRPYFKSFLEQLLKMDLHGLTSRAQADRMLARTIKAPYVRRFLLKNLSRNSDLTFEWKINLQALYENMETILTWPESGRRFNKPTLFIRGGRSDYISDPDMNRIKQNFPAAQLQTIDRASHWVHSDAPDELYAALQEFL